MIMRLHRGFAAVPPSLLAVALATTLALSGCTSFSESVASTPTAPATTSPAEPKIPQIDWTDCSAQFQPLIANQPGSDRNLKFECGHTQVPISYDEPRGATLPLFLVRVVMAGQTNRIGSLMVNPGGPGRSGADAAIAYALTLPTDVLSRFDIVGFDPRGVGLSTPVECISNDVKDRLVAAEPRPTTDAQLDDALGLTKNVADRCAKEYGDALGTFNTVDTARDMDQLRQALGDEKLTYLGYAYGSTLGSTYAQLFPDKTRALVLDGAVDPDADPKAAAEASAQALEAGLDAFATNCVGLIAGCPIGANPRQFVLDLLAQADQAAIPSSKTDQDGGTRTATPGVIVTAIRSGLADAASWPQLAQGLAAAQRGDSAGLFSLADSYSGRLEDGTYSNLLDANIAVDCADTDASYDESEIRTLAGDWGQKYPIFGAGAAVGLYTCSVWKAHRTPLPERKAPGSAALLVVGNAGDPVTPLVGAQNLANDLDNGVLLIWQGQGHTSYPKTPCITAAVDTYLIDLAPPFDGLTCPA
jgi:pimeloyl-ACP methyl ester carboxylesterase